MKDKTYTGLTVEKLREMMDYYFNQKPKEERRMVLGMGCRTYGSVIYNSHNPLDTKWCADPECSNCVNFYKGIKEEVERQIKESNDKHNTAKTWSAILVDNNDDEIYLNTDATVQWVLKFVELFPEK